MLTRLPEEEEKVMLDQEKEIRKKYELIDDKRINALKYQKAEAKLKQKEEFLAFIAKKQAWFKSFTEKREKILGFREF